MYQLAKQSIEARREFFTNTATRMRSRDALVEKDFWICFLLELLFHQSSHASHLCLKGGTSLSKGYGAIGRFSEDIDLILDWRVLGYSGTEPMEHWSNTKQAAFDDEMNEKTGIYLAGTFMPDLDRLVRQYVVEPVDFFIKDDLQTVHFDYPSIFQDPYVIQEIRLEMGPLAAWTPVKEIPIRPYVADYYPKSFSKPETSIRMVEARRTFWEKATILHREANRLDGPVPARYSRHYYDVCMLAKTTVKQEAFEDLGLLSEVAEFKSKFYHCSWARYDEATPDKIKLVPPQRNIPVLRKDYELMQMMISGAPVPFDEIMEGLRSLEDELRGIAS